jgi:hypothetical protein
MAVEVPNRQHLARNVPLRSVDDGERLVDALQRDARPRWVRS